jgi:hypothetical protein
MRPSMWFIGILVLAAPDNFPFEDLNVTCLRQIHGLNDHHFQLVIRDHVTFQIKQEIATFYIAAVCKVHAEVKLDAKLGLRIRLVHENDLSGQLQAGMTILHQFDGVPIRVCDPRLTGVIHAE